MITEQIITLRKQLKSKLEPMRFEHSVSVSFTCTALAMRYAYDIQKAELAGLMHDCAKRFTDSELIRKCQKHGVALTEAEIKAPLSFWQNTVPIWQRINMASRTRRSFLPLHAIPPVNQTCPRWTRSYTLQTILSHGVTRQTICLRCVIWHSRIWMRPCTRS